MQDELNKKKLLSIGEASEYLGVSIDTLRRWEKKERITPLRSPGGHRYFTKDDLDALFGKRYKRDEETIRRTDEELVNNPLPQDIKVEEASPVSTFGVSTEVISEPPYPAHSVEIPAELPPEKNPPQEPIINTVSQESNPFRQMPEAPLVVKTDETVKPFENPQYINPFNTQNSEKTTDTVLPQPGEILIPKANNNLLSEEEIERRLGSIIKPISQKKSNTAEILLAIFSSLVFIIDVILLYTWAMSSRLISPIP